MRQDPAAASGQSSPKRKILIADDETSLRNLLSILCLKMGYDVVEATTGAEAIETARSELPDLILMDAFMPQIDGFAATELLKARPETAPIPILILTGRPSRTNLLKGIAAGASDFLKKPFDSEELMLRVRNNLKLKELHDFQKEQAKILEESVADRTRRLEGTLATLEKANSTIETIHRDTIFRLAALAEFRDEDTGAHIKRIGYYARTLASTLGRDEELGEAIFYAAMIHDIGKVAVPDYILLKTGPLTDEEWSVIHTHTTVGAKILEGSASPYLQMGALVAQYHHERWDGSGYPFGTSGKDIPLPARIVAIADQYDALRAVRPYKPAFDHLVAVRTIEEGDGRTLPAHFDPEVLAAFRAVKDRFDEIFNRYQDETVQADSMRESPSRRSSGTL